MAIIKNSTPFDSMRKKFAKSDEIYFKNRAADNATIGVRMKHPYDGGNSTSQVAYRTAFSAAAAKTKAIMTATSSDEEQENYTLLQQYTQAFKNQHKFLYLRSYIFAQVFVKPTTV